jgi:hypothetical protein
MDLRLNDSPREFTVGPYSIEDHGKVVLSPIEMVSLVANGSECDVTRHEWGYYLGSSVNDRLANEGFKSALVMNPDGKVFINVVERDKIDAFASYLDENDSTVLCWLDELDESNESDFSQISG